MPFQPGSVIDGWKSSFPFHCLCSSGHFCHSVKAAIRSGSSSASTHTPAETAGGAQPRGAASFRDPLEQAQLTTTSLCLLSQLKSQWQIHFHRPWGCWVKTGQVNWRPVYWQKYHRSARWVGKGDPKLEWEDTAKPNSCQSMPHMVFALITSSAIIKQRYFCGSKTNCVLQWSTSEFLQNVQRRTIGIYVVTAPDSSSSFYPSVIFWVRLCICIMVFDCPWQIFLLNLPNPCFCPLLVLIML